MRDSKRCLDVASAAAGTLGLFAVYWDDAWHTDVGRDSFVVAPHLLLYTAITAAGAIAIVRLWPHRSLRRPWWRLAVASLVGRACAHGAVRSRSVVRPSMLDRRGDCRNPDPRHNHLRSGDHGTQHIDCHAGPCSHDCPRAAGPDRAVGHPDLTGARSPCDMCRIWQSSPVGYVWSRRP